jgi:hypothetical protein
MPDNVRPLPDPAERWRRKLAEWFPTPDPDPDDDDDPRGRAA